jgi:hypothetical protein
MYPASPDSLKYIIISPRIEEQKQYMRDFALIEKFLGLWPSEKDLIKWIQHWWKPKGHYDLQLGSKGFFTIILHNLEDRNRIFEGGPYFYNSAWPLPPFMDGTFQPRKGGLHACTGLDETLLAPTRILVGRDPCRDRQHHRHLRQIFRSNQANEGTQPTPVFVFT